MHGQLSELTSTFYKGGEYRGYFDLAGRAWEQTLHHGEPVQPNLIVRGGGWDSSAATSTTAWRESLNGSQTKRYALRLVREARP